MNHEYLVVGITGSSVNGFMHCPVAPIPSILTHHKPAFETQRLGSFPEIVMLCQECHHLADLVSAFGVLQSKLAIILVEQHGALPHLSVLDHAT